MICIFIQIYDSFKIAYSFIYLQYFDEFITFTFT